MRDWSAKWQQRRGDIQKMRGFWAEDKASSPATLVDFDDDLPLNFHPAAIRELAREIWTTGISGISA